MLMVDPDECAYVMENTSQNVNMLLDVAHLKVSSSSLQFNPQHMFKFCDQFINGYHLSDNNGLSDTNESFLEDAWFWECLKTDVKNCSIEVYGQRINDMKKLKDMVDKKLSKTNSKK